MPRVVIIDPRGFNTSTDFNKYLLPMIEDEDCIISMIQLPELEVPSLNEFISKYCEIPIRMKMDSVDDLTKHVKLRVDRNLVKCIIVSSDNPCKEYDKNKIVLVSIPNSRP